MNSKRDIRWVGLFVSMVLGAACDPEYGVFEPLPGEESLWRSGGGIWIGNGLREPDVTGVDPAYGLSSEEGLPSGGALLADAEGVLAAQYLVECALPLGESITRTRPSDGEPIELWGWAGLAPEWKDAACDQDCQEWVSACLLARSNASGESVTIWISADHPAIGLGRSPSFPRAEATFYGNLFSDPNDKSLCRSELQFPARTCTGLPPEACGFTDWGACGDGDRCDTTYGDFTDCAVGDPQTDIRLRSISTFIE